MYPDGHTLLLTVNSPITMAKFAGHILVSFGTDPAVMPQAGAGSIRILAAVEAERDPQLADVPTVSETIPDVVTSTWLGLFSQRILRKKLSTSSTRPATMR